MILSDLTWYNPDLNCSKKNEKGTNRFLTAKRVSINSIQGSAGVRIEYYGSCSVQHFLIIEMEFFKSSGFGKVNAKNNTFKRAKRGNFLPMLRPTALTIIA